MATMSTELSPLRERSATPHPYVATWDAMPRARAHRAAAPIPRPSPQLARQLAAQLALTELFPDLQAAADAALADLFPALRLRAVVRIEPGALP
jgi:hypothetical protein